MKIIGHRGARGLAPENTLAGIQTALDHGVDAIEIDVRVTSDAIVVLCHDPYIAGADGKKHAVETTGAASLRRLKPDLCTLTEAMDLVQSRCHLIIEVKSSVKLTEVIKASQVKLASGFPAATLTFASFDHVVLRRLHVAFPDTSLIVNEIWSSWRARWRAKELGTRRIALLEYWVWPGFIRIMKHAGYVLYVYPATNEIKKRRFRRLGFRGCTEDPARAARWNRAGLAGVISDHPELF